MAWISVSYARGLSYKTFSHTIHNHMVRDTTYHRGWNGMNVGYYDSVPCMARYGTWDTEHKMCLTLKVGIEILFWTKQKALTSLCQQNISEKTSKAMGLYTIE